MNGEAFICLLLLGVPLFVAACIWKVTEAQNEKGQTTGSQNSSM